eukprot:IDg10421t1
MLNNTSGKRCPCRRPLPLPRQTELACLRQNLPRDDARPARLFPSIFTRALPQRARTGVGHDVGAARAKRGAGADFSRRAREEACDRASGRGPRGAPSAYASACCSCVQSSSCRSSRRTASCSRAQPRRAPPDGRTSGTPSGIVHSGTAALCGARGGRGSPGYSSRETPRCIPRNGAPIRSYAQFGGGSA